MIRFYDIEKGIEIGHLEADFTGDYTTPYITISPDGKRFVARTILQVSVWDMQTRELIVKKTVEERDKHFMKAAFSADSKTLFVVNHSNDVHHWTEEE
jgi:WD40 repeat protein